MRWGGEGSLEPFKETMIIIAFCEPGLNDPHSRYKMFLIKLVIFSYLYQFLLGIKSLENKTIFILSPSDCQMC